jgi:RNA:NAD 2'-phosphotransferase (TPT1/KptA family)
MNKNIRFTIKKVLKETNGVGEIPKYLYHATYAPLLKKIKSEGLGGPSAKPMWEDSKRGVIYLATDEYVAISYAEVALDENESIPESWIDKIIVLVIDTEKLDKSKLFIDQNVLDNEGDTLEYHGIIPFEYVVKMKKTWL